MSSTVILLCKALEDEIPLVECALMLSGDLYQRGDQPVKSLHTARMCKV